MKGFSANLPDNCPPQEAIDAEGKVYRVCLQNPPLQRDFQNHAELGKQSNGDQCMRHGLSVFRNYAEAHHLTLLFPKLGKLVLGGELTPKEGKVKPTPAKARPSHTTWWPYEGIERSANFKIAKEG